MGYEYEDMRKAPESHHRVVRLVALVGCGVEEAAERSGLSEQSVRKILQHEPVQRAIEVMRSDAAKKVREVAATLGDRIDEMLRKSFDVLEGVLDDPEASRSLKVAVAKEVLDRHPEGKYVKRSKQERTDTLNVVSGSQIASLAEKALRLGIVRDGEFRIVGPEQIEGPVADMDTDTGPDADTDTASDVDTALDTNEELF